jgi:eukaryotic-like serine/threonine-protein kinase
MSDALRAALEARLGSQYAIESLLGQGGMGSVFRATDRTLHRPVAIKVISGDVASNPELKERFLLEARTVAKLRHPNIVAVYSAGDADGLLYFVMELVPGESLRELLAREGKVEPHRAERILHELALALDYAHQNGIVHRDVKPENILLDGDTGRAMLMDFGVARALEGSGNMTGTGMILGSPRYMSPEQATGEQTIDGRSDLYALALVGYEMFTGKPVVESGNVAGMLVKHLTETPKPLADAASQVPEGVAVAIDRALEKDPAKRWASGREMAEVIGMAWTPSPGSGATRAVNAAGVRARTRGRNIAIGVTAAVAFLVAFLVPRLGRDAAGDPRKSYAVVPFEIQSGNSEIQWLRDGAVNMLTLALGQWSDLQVVDYERTLKLVKDAGAEGSRVGLDQAQDIARRGGAGTIVMGQVSTTPDSLVVIARLYDARSGRALNTATRAAAIAADPRPLFDDLARYLLDVAGGSTSASVDVARATTTSLTAYRAYLDGVRYLNSWRLGQADSALRVAIEADSTFALAWHKRALALGWGDGASTEYLSSAKRAAELGDRLPPRQRALVEGHLALASGLSEQMLGTGSGRQRLREAQQIYHQLLAEDSLVAEGWYGLADAYFHDIEQGDSVPAIQRRINTSLRAFNRTLEIDSTFHLAYSHLVQQYQGLSNLGSQALYQGDSVIVLRSREQIEALGGTPALLASQERALRRGLEITRGWVRADIDASTPHVALATSYAAAGEADSALAVIERALARPALQTPGMRLQRVIFQLLADDPRTMASVREATTNVDRASLGGGPANERLQGLSAAMNAAAQFGNGAELERLRALFVEFDPTFPFSNERTEPTLRWYETALQAGMTGTVTPEQRRILAEGVRRMGAGTPGLLQQMLSTSLSVPYTAYLATRDTMFSNAVRRAQPGATAHNDLDALEALARGDTAAARTIAREYTHPDSLRTARFSLAGLRAIARAEVLAAVGNRDWAILYLEALDPRRFTMQGLAEPGFAAYTRSFAARAVLYEERGDRAKAIAAWEEFLRRTEQGDQLIEPQRRAARAALQRLRETRG